MPLLAQHRPCDNASHLEFTILPLPLWLCPHRKGWDYVLWQLHQQHIHSVMQIHQERDQEPSSADLCWSSVSHWWWALAWHSKYESEDHESYCQDPAKAKNSKVCILNRMEVIWHVVAVLFTLAYPVCASPCCIMCRFVILFHLVLHVLIWCTNIVIVIVSCSQGCLDSSVTRGQVRNRHRDTWPLGCRHVPSQRG